ncbi:MAG: phage tail family protein [Paludibacteraceae bacterium]|nr:phage tail family protein [Paludibacteraceae bacterium]
MNYIVLNGKNSNEINGLIISSLPPITKPKIRTASEEIDGRDGDIITKLGYSAYDKEFEIGLAGNYNVDDVISYFDSSGEVIFSNEQDKYYKYQIIDQIDFDRLLRFKKANVKMHVQPFKYDSIADAQVYNNSYFEIKNQRVQDTGKRLTVLVKDGNINIESRKYAQPLEVLVPIKVHHPSDKTWFTVCAEAKGTGAEYIGIRVCKDAPNNPQTLGYTIMYLQDGHEVHQSQDLTDIERDYNYLYIYVAPNHKLDVNVRISVVDTNDRFTVVNKGNTVAKPIYKIRGVGSINLYVGSVVSSKRVRMNLSLLQELIIDVNSFDAYIEDENGNRTYQNRNLLGDYNRLQIDSGQKNIIFRENDFGIIDSITLDEYSRWI